MSQENHFGRRPLSDSFTNRFAAEWRRRYAIVCIFASIVFLLPGILFAGYSFYSYMQQYSWSEYAVFFGPMMEFPGAMVVVSMLTCLFVLFPAGILMITAPRVLAPVAAGLIDRLGLLYLLYIPITEDDFGRNRFMEHFAGAPVSDTRINESFSGRIWWLSGQMKPELLLGGIPKHMAEMHGDLPYTLTNAGMPVGRLGTIIVRQWYLYFSQALSWSACCCPIGCAFILVPYFIYRVVLNVHALAYAAAYFRILTGRWPWE